MADKILFDIGQGIVAESGTWYRNVQRLGVGGNAVTFLVLATSGGARGVPFALKIFRRLSKPERRDSFIQEAAFLEKCDHPSVMRIYDRGVYFKEHPFLVADYLPRTLESVIRSNSASTVQKVGFIMQLLSALDYLSGQDPPVVHRDLKPQNIFVNGPACVLGDFGLMKHVETDVEDDVEFVKESIGYGMPYRYRTPDLVAYLNGESNVTPKSDVFQLGLVAAELFTGRNPLRRAKKFTDPVELNSLGKVPGAHSQIVTNLIEKMLVLDPSGRDNPAGFIDKWQGIFFDAVERSHALEGRAF